MNLNLYIVKRIARNFSNHSSAENPFSSLYEKCWFYFSFDETFPLGKNILKEGIGFDLFSRAEDNRSAMLKTLALHGAVNLPVVQQKKKKKLQSNQFVNNTRNVQYGKFA